MTLAPGKSKFEATQSSYNCLIRVFCRNFEESFYKIFIQERRLSVQGNVTLEADLRLYARFGARGESYLSSVALAR